MWQQIRSNQRKTVILMVLMAGLLLGLGYFLGEFVLAPGMGVLGVVTAFIVWLILAMTSFWGGDSIFLAMAGAKKIEKKDHPVLFNIVEEMTIASGLPKMPDVYIIDQAAPNAFATGRSPQKASVAVTAGLLQILDRDELQGVVAHELGHVKNRDILYMIMVGVMLGAIVLLADIGLRIMIYGGRGRRRTSSDSGGGQAQVIILVVALVLAILAPIIAQLIYFTLSRKREYLADASGAQFSRYPEGLARALEKIAGSPQRQMKVSRVAAPSYIINPLRRAARGSGGSWFSTHPPTAQRINILRSLAGRVDLKQYDDVFRKVTGRPVGLFPAGSVVEGRSVMAQKPKISDSFGPLQRMRQTTDALWRLNQFTFIPCSCGTKLKVPPPFIGKTIDCPHCGISHRVSSPAS